MNPPRMFKADWETVPPALRRLRKRFLSKRRMHYALDFLVMVVAFLLAYLLRFDFRIPRVQYIDLFTQLPYVVLIQMIALSLAGVYTFIWRYVGMSEIRAVVNSTLWSLLPILVLRLALPSQLNDWRVPLSIILMVAAVVVRWGARPPVFARAVV